MNTVSLQALNSSNILHHTNEGQRHNTGAQSDHILQAWRDWANAAVRGKFDTEIVVGELRHEKALPTLEKCLNKSNVKMDLSELWQESFPASFPSHITSINFRRNMLTDVTAIMDSLPNTLTNLNLSFNPIVNPPEHYPPYLRTLLIFSCEIKKLSNDFVTSLPTSLERLDLSSNYLTSLPQNISALPAGLEKLVLMNNKLTDIPEALFTLPASCEIYTVGNPIPAERKQQIEARINAPDYQGPRIVLHEEPADNFFYPYNWMRRDCR